MTDSPMSRRDWPRCQRVRATAAPLLVLLAVALGCGSGGHVSGKVTTQGQAVPGAKVAFAPEGRPAETYYGVADQSGAYLLDLGAQSGLTPGKYQVTVTDEVQTDGSRLPAGEEGSVLRQNGQTVTRWYGLSKEVAAGKNEIELKLEEAQVLPPPQEP